MTRNAEHERLRELVLVHEDLEDDERLRADEHLARCAECRALLDRLRGAEGAARALGELPPLENAAAYALDDATRSEADRSLAMLEERTGQRPRASEAVQRTVGPRAFTWAMPKPRLGPSGAWRPALALAGVAALVAVVVMWPRPAGVPVLLREARVAPYSGPRGLEAGGWHTGDAFVIELDLAAQVSLVVFHVDPQGRIALLHPADAGLVPQLFPAGTTTLPPAGVVWRLEGEPGSETFVIAASARVDRALRGISAADRVPTGTRAERILALEAELERTVGPVRRLEIQHLP